MSDPMTVSNEDWSVLVSLKREMVTLAKREDSQFNYVNVPFADLLRPSARPHAVSTNAQP